MSQPYEPAPADPFARGQDPAEAIEQLRRLQLVTEAALGHLSVEELLDELLERVRDILDVDTAAILILDVEARELVARAAKGLEAEVERGVRIPLGKGFAGRIAAERRPVIIPKVDRGNVFNPILVETGIRSLLGVPLLAQGAVLGVMHVGTLTERDFTPEDVELMQLVADRVALALHVRLYERERFVADTLQRSFLPEEIPQIPGLQIATRYRPGSQGIHIGGDWYDVFTVPDGRVSIAIGDVAGRGLAAAALMGRVRNALRAYALDGLAPVEVVTRLDRMIGHFDPGELVTLVFGSVDPDLDLVRLVVAGHVPPMLLGPDRASLIEPTDHHDPPLGTAVPGQFHEREVPLLPGTSLVLYTDGLIERRKESLLIGLERLRAAGAAVADPLDTQAVADELLRRLLAGRGAADDVAMLVLGRDDPGGPLLRTAVQARPRELAPLRRALRRWLREQNLEERVVQDVLTAAGEATANAIEHAYDAAQGWVYVDAEFTGDSIVIVIRDTGTWRPPRRGDRGRGLSLMRAMMDDIVVDQGIQGTIVTMRRRVT